MKRLRYPSLFGLCLVLAQAGCVTLLPKEQPVRLYRFGDRSSLVESPATAAPSSAPPTVVTHLPPASQGDQLLTVTGLEAAYVRGARWVSPAAELFQAAAEQAFRRETAPTLVGRRVVIDVTAFEVDFTATAPGLPRVRIDAIVTVAGTGAGATRTLHIQLLRPVSANSMASIVEEFDIATQLILKTAVEYCGK